MPKSHELFHSADGHRLILVADDEMVNRAMLGEILKEDYEVIYANDGGQALEMIREHKNTLSLVLLDILMPVMSGLEVLKEVRADPELSHIPVIVTTAEKETEIESLNLGAIDFIPKPYPAAGVILARVLRTIELSEDRDIIQQTERDALTGLYNREFFYRYAEQYDQFHVDKVMDAVIVDVNHFHILNERFGRAYGDEILERIGEQIKKHLCDSDGITCRREADTFMVYCPHREDYQIVLDHISASLAGDGASKNRVRLRMGIYSSVDKNIDIDRRLDRAKMAADTVKGSFTENIGYYSEEMHERELYAEQLIEEFPTAIANNQFEVYYQPKFDVRPDTPILASAEALVRWVHPTLGTINPGVFISLFEDNGLIRTLDTYVWKETARQIREWKDRLNYSVPVSVNVSRIDMYDPALPDTLVDILNSYDLSPKDILLEVTESAYTQDSMQIIQTVENLRSLGFMIEMDDFGTGYSSLNMISDLPIDALKLDMRFIRNAFKEGGNTHMLEVIIGISDFLSVPVVAEGVETEEQLHALKNLGCDLVQGYFFSRPVPAVEFEPFILQKREADLASAQKPDLETGFIHPDAIEQSNTLKAKMTALGVDDEPSENESASSTVVAKPAEFHTGIQLRTASIFFVVLALLAATALIIADLSVSRGYARMVEASDRYIAAQQAASDMESASDYLSDRVRCFVVTGEVDYLKDFYEEIETTRRRDRAVETLENLMGYQDNGALANLNTALGLSNELVDVENKAMRLVVEGGTYNPEDIPETVRNVELTDEEKALTPSQLKERAQTMVFDNNYIHYKDRIRENVGKCTESLIKTSSQELDNSSTRLAMFVNIQTAMTVVFLLIVLAIVMIITGMIRKPLTTMVEKMRAQEEIVPTGVEELRFVTRTYNQILQDNQEAREKLKHEASHDALTGLFNRGAYDLLMQSTDTAHMALILIDVDYFKEVNDTYGHAVGDRVLKRVADILRQSFRSVDILCRIGGDEFVVVMTRADSSMSQLVLNKIARANNLLQHPKDDLPPVSLSVGVAFSDRENPQGDIFKDADTALYRVKEAGRKGCMIF